MTEPSVQDLGSELLRRREAREGLIPFITYTKPDYEVAKHHQFVAGYLEAVERGEIKRLIINMPPRHGKSEMVTRRFPAWFLGRHPDKFIISASYNADFATDFGREVRQIVASPEYALLFPGTVLRADSRAADRWNTERGGAYFAAGVGSGITGRGMHLGIVDDPIKDEEEANNPRTLEKIWRWYKTAFKTRMMPNAAQVLCMTRWAKADLCGRVLEEEGDKWTVINLPAIADEDDPLGRQPGDPLWPEWYNREAMDDMYDTFTQKEWASLYQGKPIPEGGHLFKSTWWKYYRNLPPIDCVVQSWDTAFETEDRNSYSVCTTWGVAPHAYVLMNVFRDKLEYDELENQINVMGNRFRPVAVVIEKKASGIVLVQRLQNISRFPIIPVNVIKDKVSRAKMITPLFASGRVLVPALAPWADIYKAELEEFPGGKFDDQVDSTSNGLAYLQEQFGFSETVGGSQDAEMDWDPYNYRGESQVIRHWDPYAPRSYH